METTYEIIKSRGRGLGQRFEVLEDVVREAINHRHTDVEVVVVLLKSGYYPFRLLEPAKKRREE